MVVFCLGKLRSHWYVEAREIFESIDDWDNPDVGKLARIQLLFLNWYEEYVEGRVGRLRGLDGSKYCFVRLFCRFMDQYKELIRRKVWFLLRDFKPDLMLTFTMEPMGNLAVEFDYVSRFWCRVRAWMFKENGHFSYVKVLEVTRKGRPHLHVLVSGWSSTRTVGEETVKWLEEEDIFNVDGSLFRKGLRSVWGHFVKVRHCWSGFKAGAYVLKYVYKSLKAYSGFDLRYASLLFASNKRSFSWSQDLAQNSPTSRVQSGEASRERSPEYVFEGCCSRDSFDFMCEKLELPLDRHVNVVELTSSLMSEFPLVFGGDVG